VADLPRIAVLASGEGTNLQALIDRLHGRDVQIVGVGTDKPGARALERAAAAGIPTRAFPLADYADRPARDAAIAGWLRDDLAAGVIVLAGYMALLTPGFIAAFRDRIVNVHPSLLPQFPGLRAIEQALEAGAAETGVTVHLVDEGVDTGPVLLQQAVPIADGADAAIVRAALAPVEHDLLCRAVAALAVGHAQAAGSDRIGGL
jgi:phosphoribosylglycinamide formyltransferase-1